ncbi:hypothetical protein TNCV_924551 [Trichonephila clavipes]|nr:hypothetical protein TNCV_924551 [Trichonephila clavipes]
MSTGDWRIFPSPSVPCLNCGGGDMGCRHLSSGKFRRANSYCHLFSICMYRYDFDILEIEIDIELVNDVTYTPATPALRRAQGL